VDASKSAVATLGFRPIVEDKQYNFHLTVVSE